MNFGHVADMLGRLKSNANLLGKNRFRDIKKKHYKYHRRARLEFQKASPEEIKILKKKIRRSAAIEKTGVYVAIIVSVLITLLFFIWVFTTLSDRYGT